MKKVAIFAALIPYIIFGIALLIQQIPGAGSQGPFVFGIIWLFVSPLWFAGGCLVAYREGQWSKK